MLKILYLEGMLLVKTSFDALLTAFIWIHWRESNYGVKCDVLMLAEVTTLVSKLSGYFTSFKYTCLWYSTHTTILVLIF